MLWPTQLPSLKKIIDLPVVAWLEKISYHQADEFSEPLLELQLIVVTICIRVYA